MPFSAKLQNVSAKTPKGKYSITQSMSLKAACWTPSHACSIASTEARLLPESTSARAARPKRIAKTMIGRNLPSASAANGFWKRLVRKVPKPAEAELADIAFTPSM